MQISDHTKYWVAVRSAKQQDFLQFEDLIELFPKTMQRHKQTHPLSTPSTRLSTKNDPRMTSVMK